MSDDEFYDAPEPVLLNDKNEEKSNELRSNQTTSNEADEIVNKEDFVPLHEKLNRSCGIKDEQFVEEDVAADDDEDEVIAGNFNQDPADSYFVDEEALKIEEENLTEDDKLARHTQSQEKKELGNKYFKEANYNSAIETYTQALRECPLDDSRDRSILYSNRSVCFLKLLDTDRCIKDCTKSIELDAAYTKPLARRAECYETTDKLDDALADYKRLVQLEPKVYSHTIKCNKLEAMINDRNEKMKAEMMSKLKDLGNMILKPFGLSTNNFQLQQDPNSGSYSVNFKQ